MQHSASLFPALLTVLCLFYGGCGGVSDRPVTAPVEGTVTFDGQPLSGAVVTFWDTAGKNNPTAGDTDASGKYKLAGSNQGAQPGSYKVTVQHFTTLEGGPLTTSEGIDREQLVQQGQAKQSLPESYSDYVNSKLSAKVEAGKTNTVDFPLKSDGS
jgi:hypothetical protein